MKVVNPESWERNDFKQYDYSGYSLESGIQTNSSIFNCVFKKGFTFFQKMFTVCLE